MSEEPEVLHVSSEIVRAENEKAVPVDLVIYDAGRRVVIGKAGYNGKHLVAMLSPNMPQFAETMLRNVKGEFVFQLPRGTTLYEKVEIDVDEAYKELIGELEPAVDDPA